MITTTVLKRPTLRGAAKAAALIGITNAQDDTDETTVLQFIYIPGARHPKLDATAYALPAGIRALFRVPPLVPTVRWASCSASKWTACSPRRRPAAA